MQHSQETILTTETSEPLCIHREREAFLQRACWDNFWKLFNELPLAGEVEIKTSGPEVGVSYHGDLSDEQKKKCRDIIAELKPWRKGPFDLFGHFIDSEWRSNLKWDRLAPHLGDVKGKVVGDIGCGNGYYMFRLSDYEPKLVLGFDPAERFFLQFQLFQRYIKNPSLHFLLLGLEHLVFYSGFFDLLLCCGVYYHRRDPVAGFKVLRTALKPGGRAIVEGFGIEGESATFLSPSPTYGKAKNVYCIPTGACLLRWLEEAGFSSAEIVSFEKTTAEEQRKTAFIDGESLEHFLHPEDPEKTIEGYPAPKRFVAVAYR